MDEYSERMINMVYTSWVCVYRICSHEPIAHSLGASYLERNARNCSHALHFWAPQKAAGLLDPQLQFNPARLGVFFPALAFGWLKAKEGGIVGPIVFHTLCNVLLDLLLAGCRG